MEINIDGKLYIHFIKSLFEDAKKIGIEIIIDNLKSDFKLIDGFKRLNVITNNKIKILNGNYPKDINLLNTKYLCDVNITIQDNTIKINNLNIIKIDKQLLPDKKVNNSIYLNKYATGKNKTVYDIMNILKTNKN